MTDRPIIFSAPMVRALLDGRKTQTRRVIDGPDGDGWHVDRVGPTGWQWTASEGAPRIPFKPRYAVGDRLWVRETWTPETDRGIGYEPPFADRPILWSEGVEGDRYWTQPHYRATDPVPDLSYPDRDGPSCIWRPSIYMPRWASRLTLIVTDVRVQQLQEISEDDARAEGALPWTGAVQDSRIDYRRIWNDIHGPEAWAANPWVVAVSFRAARRNIDDGEPR